MENELNHLREENAELKRVLRKVSQQLDELRETIDALNTSEKIDKNAPVTDNDVKSLLKKYSRL